MKRTKSTQNCKDKIFCTDKSQEKIRNLIRISQINHLIRDYLWHLNFVEIDLPILSRYNAIAPINRYTTKKSGKNQFELKISNAEDMKKAITEGFDKIFHIGKCFRNEKIDDYHQPEFTQLAIAQSYIDYEDGMKLVENLISNLKLSHGNLFFFKNGRRIDLTPPWQRIPVRKFLMDMLDIDIEDYKSPIELFRNIKKKGIKISSKFKYGGFLKMSFLVDQLINIAVKQISKPIFLIEYPHYLAGPAEEIQNNPKYKKRSELFISGIELANVSNTQNNPDKLIKWYTETVNLRKKKGDLHIRTDVEYLNAVKRSPRPCVTIGMGLERLYLFILNLRTLEESLLFPFRTENEYD